jgi:hypothetical protein
MFYSLISRPLVCGSVVVAAMVAALPDAEAAAVRVKFTPPYGLPFPDLEWSGEAVIDDGGCLATGTVLNFSGACDGLFSVKEATLTFESVSNPNAPKQTISFGETDFGEIIYVQRTQTGDIIVPDDWQSVVSSPFKPVQGTIDQTKYNGEQAFFSLIFVGGYAQLFWFGKDPGWPALVDPLKFPYVKFPESLIYGTCYLAGPGDQNGDKKLDKENEFFGCGLSSNVGGNSGKLFFTEVVSLDVPEPSSYALMLAGLGAMALSARRRTRRA